MRRHAFPVAMVLIALLITRQVYPYVSGNEPSLVDGYVVEEVASGLGGPTCLVWYDTVTLLVCDRDEGQNNRPLHRRNHAEARESEI